MDGKSITHWMGESSKTLACERRIEEKWCADFVVLSILFEMNNERMVVNEFKVSKPTEQLFRRCVHVQPFSNN